jgi:serine/threonine-protein kinase RsbT
MNDTSAAAITISHEADVANARRLARDMAHVMGFSRPRAYSLATAVSEFASNLCFHATSGGVLRLRPIKRDGRKGIEVIVEDNGPGISDVENAMLDGYSTNGGLGSGLPGGRRLMDEFEIETKLGCGTRIAARIWLP